MITTTPCVPSRKSKIHATVQLPAVRLSALLLLSGVLTYAQTAPVVLGYYMESTTFPLNTLVTNGSLARLTHLSYAFADIKDTVTNPNTNPPTHKYECALHDPAGEIGPAGVFQQLKALKTAKPSLKILISVGGALGSSNFTYASDAAHRTAFIQSCVDLFIDGQFASPKVTGLFDGIDVDWEFPKAANDVANYTSLLQAFRAKLDIYKQNHPAVQQRLLLTSAINPQNGNQPWNLQNINLSSSGATPHVDFFNVMTYDYAGSWNEKTSSTAPLSSITYNVSDLMAQGLPASKIVLGIPFYGVHYTGNFAGNTANTPLSTLLAQASKSPVLVQPDPYSEPGTQNTDYATIVNQTLTDQNGNSNLAVGRSHDGEGSAWAFDATNKLLWVYDDEVTIRQKATWARSLGLAGLMTWEIGKDTADGKLLCTMEAAANGIAGSVCTSTTPPPPPPATMLFDFETGIEGWNRTGGVFNVLSSTERAATGTKSLSVSFITYRQTFQPKGTVWVTPPAAVHGGSKVEFRIWVPGTAFQYLTAITPFFMDAPYSWTSTSVDLTKLTANAWNTVSVTVPNNAVIPYTQIGIQFDSSRGWNGTIFIDSVTVR